MCARTCAKVRLQYGQNAVARAAGDAVALGLDVIALDGYSVASAVGVDALLTLLHRVELGAVERFLQERFAGFLR